MKKKIRKKYTLKEFQAWLSGIEEIQPDNWHPDLDQWKLIRERMDNIIADVRERVVEVEVVREVPVRGPAATPPPPMPPVPLGPPAPPPLVPPVVVPENSMTPAAAAALKGELPVDGTTPPGGPVHRLPTDPATLDPNTPGTPYATSFA